jgi:hypothetical protein
VVCIRLVLGKKQVDPVERPLVGHTSNTLTVRYSRLPSRERIRLCSVTASLLCSMIGGKPVNASCNSTDCPRRLPSRSGGPRRVGALECRTGSFLVSGASGTPPNWSRRPTAPSIRPSISVGIKSRASTRCTNVEMKKPAFLGRLEVDQNRGLLSSRVP